MATTKSPFNTVLLKLTGQGLAGDKGIGFDRDRFNYFCQEIIKASPFVKMGIVVGGGNIVRGRQAKDLGLRGSTTDKMGMLATTMNCLALHDILKSAGVSARVQTAIQMNQIAEPFIDNTALRHLEKGRILIFAGGIGRPNFTTDTAAALRGVDIGADILLKGTRVNGIFASDPEKDPGADQFAKLSFKSAIAGEYAVMDSSAFTVCRDNSLGVRVFNMDTPGNLLRAVMGEDIGTLVDPSFRGEPVLRQGVLN